MPRPFFSLKPANSTVTFLPKFMQMKIHIFLIPRLPVSTLQKTLPINLAATLNIIMFNEHWQLKVKS